MTTSENESERTGYRSTCLCGRPVLVLEPPLRDARIQNHCEHIIPRKKQLTPIRSCGKVIGWWYV